jgi:hypothetical protein
MESSLNTEDAGNTNNNEVPQAGGKSIYPHSMSTTSHISLCASISGSVEKVKLT